MPKRPTSLPPYAVHGLLSRKAACTGSSTRTGLSQLPDCRHCGDTCRRRSSPHWTLLTFSWTAVAIPCLAIMKRVLFMNARSLALLELTPVPGSQTWGTAAIESAVYLLLDVPGDDSHSRFRKIRR